jgi:omega-6 fatty acid desaturase (delta-12 desaturase)
MVMSPIMGWFTANIGYHHIHHLNARIPFYRLPEARAAIPELQNPKTTSLNPLDILRYLRLKVWDVEAQQMVGLPNRYKAESLQKSPGAKSPQYIGDI